MPAVALSSQCSSMYKRGDKVPLLKRFTSQSSKQNTNQNPRSYAHLTHCQKTVQLPSTSDSKLNYVRSLTVTLTLLTFLHCQIRPSYARLLPAMVSSNYYFLPQIFSPDAASSNEHSLLTGLYYWSSLFEPFC